MRDLPERVGSKYKFITVSAKRCEMLQKGARPKIETDHITKFTTVAMEEVLDDLIDFQMIAEKDDDAPFEEVVFEAAPDVPAIVEEEEKAEAASEGPAEKSKNEAEKPTE